jgi:hypothetical protein
MTLVKSMAYTHRTHRGTRFGTRALPSAADVLAWLERHAVDVTVQELPPSRRWLKNRAIVQYRGLDGQIQAVGTTITGAVWKTAKRLQAAGGA